MPPFKKKGWILHVYIYYVGDYKRAFDDIVLDKSIDPCAVLYRIDDAHTHNSMLNNNKKSL
jgi:hypothetical protein